jgi:hypothetical protein
MTYLCCVYRLSLFHIDRLTDALPVLCVSYEINNYFKQPYLTPIMEAAMLGDEREIVRLHLLGEDSDETNNVSCHFCN